MLDLFSLGGRVALVTGASSGLGWAVAQALAGSGAAVVLVARRADRLEANARRLPRAAFVAGDLADRAAIPGLAERAAAPFGAPDILVNAAGINPRQHADAVTEAAWDETLALDLSAPFFLARALVPAMKEKRWGRVINIASLQSARAFPDGIAYGAAKGGLVQLTRAMAEAWSRDGIMCNAIAPGFFETELTRPIFADSEAVGHLAAQTAIGRTGTPEDLFGAAIFLASRASDYVTGQTLFVDGGWTAR